MDDTTSTRLVIVDGPETGRVFTFEAASSFLVGRSPKGHLVLDPHADRYVSRVHCLIDIRPPRILLNDLGSTNGTFVNGRRVTRSEVRDGDEIRVGRTRIRVVAGSAGQPLGPAAADAALDAHESEWRPPDTTGSWAPPVVGRPAVDRASVHCASCGTDIGPAALSDGLATELPDATYLCSACEEPLPIPAHHGGQPPGVRILEELGRGGMGVVYKALQQATRRVVAVKETIPQVDLDHRRLRLFEREIAVHSSVRHPNLARFLTHGNVDGRPYLVTEYLAGGDAGSLVREVFKGPLPISLAVRIGLDVLNGVAALHAAGFVHRDLKPQNILLSRPPEAGFGAAKVTDYGLAKPFEDVGHSLFDLTRDNEAAGSMMYMPPEQILDFRHVRPPADVYAAGASLYFLLTGRFTVESPIHSYVELDAGTVPAQQRWSPFEAMIEGEPIPIRERRADLPSSIAEIIDSAVTKEVGHRPSTAAAFRDRLAEAAAREGLQ